MQTSRGCVASSGPRWAHAYFRGLHAPGPDANVAIGRAPEQSGVELSPGRGVVSGVALDCQGRPMRGGVLRLFGQNGEEIDASQVVYFNGQTPPGIDPAQPYGNRDGRYAVVDMVPAEAARVELWGVPDGETEPVLVACEETGVQADSLSILVLHPARSDGPAECGQNPW